MSKNEHISLKGLRTCDIIGLNAVFGIPDPLSTQPIEEPEPEAVEPTPFLKSINTIEHPILPSIKGKEELIILSNIKIQQYNK